MKILRARGAQRLGPGTMATGKNILLGHLFKMIFRRLPGNSRIAGLQVRSLLLCLIPGAAFPRGQHLLLEIAGRKELSREVQSNNVLIGRKKIHLSPLWPDTLGSFCFLLGPTQRKGSGFRSRRKLGSFL